MPKNSPKPIYCPSCFEVKQSTFVMCLCGFREPTTRPPLYLPYRTRIAGTYLVGKDLAHGETSITYIAINENEKLVLKEYFPRQLAKRGKVGVFPFNEYKREIFEKGRALFRESAVACLASSHKNLVKAHAILDDNQTSYLVMDYIEGATLVDHVGALGGKLSPSEAITIIIQILDAVEVIHKRQFVHLDITPSNILMRNSVEPVLIDFGSARTFPLRDESEGFLMGTVGYAPPEQASETFKSIGPWTDIYACAATLYFMLMGHPPASASERSGHSDPLFSKEEVRSLSRSLTNTIRRALSSNPRSRPSVEKFSGLLQSVKERLNAGGPPPSTTARTGFIRRLPQAVKALVPHVLLSLGLVLLGMLLFASSAAFQLPNRNASSYEVLPASYYVIRDKSESPIEERFDLAEEIILRTFRPAAQPEGDRSSFSFFGSDVCGGYGLSIPLASPGPSVIAKLKDRARGNCPSLAGSTKFDTLFDRLHQTIRRETRRRSFVFVLTDGLPNKGGREYSCSEELPNPSELIDQDTASSVERFMSSNQNVRVLFMLVGGTQACLGGIEKPWRELTARYGDRFLIVTPSDPTSDSIIQKEIYDAMQRWNRSPCITTWPKYVTLPADQAEALAKGQDFQAPFYFQAHLLQGSTSLLVRAAQLTTPVRGSRTIPIDVALADGRDLDLSDPESLAKVDLSSDGMQMSSPVTMQELYFHPRQRSGIRRGETYALSLIIEGPRVCTWGQGNPQPLRVAPLQATPDEIKRRSWRRIAAFVVTAAFVIFSTCCYIYRKKYDQVGATFEAFFIDPFWHWVSFFLVAGLMFLTYLLMSGVANSYIPLVGTALFLENIPLSRDIAKVFKEETDSPKPMQVFLSFLSSVSSVILALIAGGS